MKKSRMTSVFSFFLTFTLPCIVVMASAPRASTAVPIQRPSVSLPAGVVRVTAVEGITEYRWPNGLRALLFPDQSKQTITVNITYMVGSKHENYGETGMAHLLEHLVFKGTPRHPNIPQELTEHGTRPNGSTWFDRTNYFETFAATDENLEWALDLEADRMINSFIAKKDLDSEMTVVRNEFEAGENSPFGVLLERVLSTAYLWHNYGNSTIGARSDIENVAIDRLQAFYRTFYQPDNAILLVAGRIDETKTLNLINRHFGTIPSPTRVLPAFYTREPTQDGERDVTLRRVGDVQLVAVSHHVPAGSHPDYAAVDVLTQVLGDTPSGRLHRALVETRKATRVFGFNFQLQDPGVALFGAEVRLEASLDEARDSMLQVIEALKDNPPTADEVNRAKNNLLKQIELNLNSSDRVGLELSEWAAMGDWRLLFLHRDRLRSVSTEDVKRVAATYLKPSNRTVGLFLPSAEPDRSEIPETPDVSEMLKEYRGSEGTAEGEVFDPSPANIEARTIRSQKGGLKLALLPKKTRGEAVTASMTIRYGDERSLANQTTVAELAGRMLMRGTAKRSRQQIQDELDRLKARAFAFGGATSAGFSIETTRANLPDVLRLMAEVLREPSFPVDEFEQLKQESLARIEQQRSEPQSVAFLEFQRHLNPYPKGDVRYAETVDGEIQNLKAATLDDVRGFHSRFYGASHGELAIVGDCDQLAVSTLVGELFESWKSPSRYERVPRLYHDVPAINQSFETPDKANAVFVAGMNLALRDDCPEYPALVLGNYILGGGFLNSRLASRIRQKEGLSYGVGSQIRADSFDKAGGFLTYAIYAPENAARLEAAFKEEIGRILSDGVTEEEVSAAKSGWLQSRQVSRAQDRELTGRLASYLYLDRTLEWDAQFERKINALTPEQIRDAMRRHIDPAKISIIKAGDFVGAAAKK